MVAKDPVMEILPGVVGAGQVSAGPGAAGALSCSLGTGLAPRAGHTWLPVAALCLRMLVFAWICPCDGRAEVSLRGARTLSRVKNWRKQRKG